MEIRKYFKLNFNKNLTHTYLRDATKALLREEMIVLQC